MTPPRPSLVPPPPWPTEDPQRHFAQAAERLLFQTRLEVLGQPCRLVEIEFYWYSASHPDPFCHRHPLQREPGRWYFHRMGEAYRGGSFKGLDITFSDGQGWGGILLRGLQLPDGTITSGPSRLVDAVLRLAGQRQAADLDRLLQGRHAEDVTAPLCLRRSSEAEGQGKPGDASIREMYATARVGLTLRRERACPAGLRFLLRPYRFLIQPRALAAGRPQLILALYLQGHTPDRIQALTGTPAAAIRRYLQAYQQGQKARPTPAQFQALIRRPLTGPSWCFLSGLLAQLEAWPDAALARLFT
ncbi:MAG: hypothetical protein WHU94_12415 [Thermogemmata sp.]|jgi:hypothetical protein